MEDAGYEPYEKRLLGITAMSQTLGRKKFEELLGTLIYKPLGKPVLVPESDKRPAMNTAINDFKENEEDNKVETLRFKYHSEKERIRPRPLKAGEK